MRQIPGANRGSRSRSSYVATEVLIASTESNTSNFQSDNSHAANNDSIITVVAYFHNKGTENLLQQGTRTSFL